jgi:hypothetical protein
VTPAGEAPAYEAPRVEERTRIDVPLIGNGGSGIVPCAAFQP